MSANYPFFEFGKKTYVMGILNVTPDSFSGDGLLSSTDTVKAALELAQRFVEAGVDILDIGGESTRPGAEVISAEEELKRVLPVIEAIRSSGLNTLISIDTYKANVARAALDRGAHWINDVWGLRADPEMGKVAADYHSPIILMHNASNPAQAELQERLGGRYVSVKYGNLIEEVNKELLESVTLAMSAGVEKRQIILDPGIGFGKTVEQNLELINRLDEIKALGYPVLVGSIAQIVYRVYAKPASRGTRGRNRGNLCHWHCPRRGYHPGARCGSDGTGG